MRNIFVAIESVLNHCVHKILHLSDRIVLLSGLFFARTPHVGKCWFVHMLEWFCGLAFTLTIYIGGVIVTLFGAHPQCFE